jgi:5'-methylthioadenosine phosphorylase
VFLAREAQMAYATVWLVTDYDCWLEDPSQHVNVASIFELYVATLKNAAKVLDALLAQPLPVPERASCSALGGAMLAPDAAVTEEQKLWLNVLRR